MKRQGQEQATSTKTKAASVKSPSRMARLESPYMLCVHRDSPIRFVTHLARRGRRRSSGTRPSLFTLRLLSWEFGRI
jgi:hypothetical protein